MNSSTLQGQPQPLNNEGTTDSEKCQICQQPLTSDNVINCNNCHLPYHLQCSEVTNNNNLWNCTRCTADEPPMSTVSVSSHHSNNSSKGSHNRIQLELQRLEEEKQLEKDFLRRKYEILKQMQADESRPNSATNSIRQWLNNQPDLDQHDLLQTDSHVPILHQKSNITSNQIYTTTTQPILASTSINNNIPQQQNNPSLFLENLPSNNLQNTIINNPGSAEMQSNTQRNQVPCFQQSLPSFSDNAMANSSQHHLTQQQINSRQTVPKELPIFTGNPVEWPLFNSTYEWSTSVCGLTDAENLVRLQKSLRGDALKSVQHILIHPNCVSTAISTLKLLFGHPEKILNSIKNKIKLLPSVNANKLETITSYALEVQGLKTTIEVCGMYDELNNSSLLQDLINKMPVNLQLNWGTHKMKLIKENKKANLSEFSHWLYDVGVSANSVNFENYSAASSSTENISQKKQTAYIHTHSYQNQRSCVLCNSNCNNVAECDKFLSADRNERWNIIRKYNLCKLCLRRHYGACKSNVICGVGNCKIKHNTLLHSNQNIDNKEANNENQQIYHGNEVETSNESKNICNETHNVNTQSSNFNKILFKIVPIKIFGQYNKTLETFAFIDEGSSVSLIDESIIEQLNLCGVLEPLCLKWTNNMERNEKSSQKLSINLAGPNNKKHFVEVRTVRYLSLPTQSIDYSSLSKQYPYLKGLPIKSYKDAVPCVLIGLNNINVCTSNRIKEGLYGEPIAICSRLGWYLCGNISGKQNPNKFSCVHVCSCNDNELNSLVKQFYAIETAGVSGNSKFLSKEDERAIEILKKYTTQKLDGRYETALLWRHDNFTLPESFTMAKRRLNSLEKGLKNNTELLTIFRNTLSEYLEKNYVTKLKHRPESAKNVWYLPIFPVFNKNKPKKTRIVWDAASKAHGVSLNSVLLKGPDLLASLLAILFKFREKQIAVTADIEQMFHRIYVRKEDRDAQRFLWRDCDLSKDPEIYVMNVLIFGASCSPCISQFVKNLNAEKYELKFPEAANAIKNNHYVDDFLISTDTAEEALKLSTDVHFIHSQAGFNLRNWCSNNIMVLEKLNVNKSEYKCLNMADNVKEEKVLGIFWEPSKDFIIFKISPLILNSDIYLGNKKPTKRQVLKILMSVYDPLGLIGHFLMFLKIAMQEIWRSGVGWDEPILAAQTEKLSKWFSILPEIKNFKIPRCYLQCISSYESAFVELHTFVDASQNGYAAVAYLRISSNKSIIVSLVGSKTRVAPLKVASVPRLELMAALIGARFAKNIIERHNVKVHKKVFWSDSKTVLCWIRSDHRKYNQFVAVRVSEILDSSEIKEWRWVPGKLNVADDATKWSHMPDLTESSRWIGGPNFLKLPEENWPVDETILESTEIEIKQVNYIMHLSSNFIEVGRFSRWCRLVKAVAYVIKFCNFVKNRIIKSKLAKELSQDEIKFAEILLVKDTQKEYFACEISTLQQNKSVLKSSSIYKLSPFLDDDFVIRVGGRIDNANVPKEMKNPAILPKNSYVTKLIILHFHNQFQHVHHETAINELRQRFYIPHLRHIFKQVIKCCQMCKIKKPVSVVPQMAKLPRARLSAYVAPFTFTGVDYFGPIHVTVNRHKEKRYGALFTCLTIRAVHIEIVNSLNTSSCIMAIRNFSARRGTPREYFSDNGTNFIGADRELKQALRDVDNNQLIRSFTTATTKWNFNPPSAPHMGGAWERMVRSVKSVLSKISTQRSPSDEILRSMMAEVENIINSRPLTYVPIENENMEALTPNHFLLGNSNGMKPLATYDDTGVFLQQSWLSAQQFAEEFWKRWVAEYLPMLTCRTKWYERSKPLEVGDLVVVVDPMNPRNVWPRGKVIEVFKADDGQVRKAKIMTTSGVLERPAIKIAVLDVTEKLE